MDKSLRLLLLLLTLALVGSAHAFGQTPASPEREPGGFDREYLDPDAYRSGRVILHDWPALTRLVRWSSRLESALSEEDATLSAELLVQFRARVDSLAGEPVPGFLRQRADSVRSTLAMVDSFLTRAEASLAALPPAPTPTGGEALNEPERQRTLVTGRTAVTVPAGVLVGEADSLPTAELPAAGENFTDLVVLALTEIDRLVHMTRSTGQGATERRAAETPSPPPGTAPLPPGP
ncbi:hypothetical protein BH18GEM1_BH18GEM1_20010 [soil metagenome]